MENITVHHLIILDESGSMNSIKPLIISGFNETVQSIRGTQLKYPEQSHLVTVLSFNTLEQKFLLKHEPVTAFTEINSFSYHPEGLTPLFDAIGQGIAVVQRQLTEAAPAHVLVTIMTDGAENASREYTGEMIRAQITALTEQDWVFTYIGTDHDVYSLTDRLAIKHRMGFQKNERGIEEMFDEDRKARNFYSKSLRMNKKIKRYFDQTLEEA